ncbi:hypothetical protein HMPREF1991_02454 [Hoylesella loescheii DSM 19665 = JCM 12249 = ATCC 15930]|uniref:Uncharacterized protein n=1 Tax=Hoylesella loescheii DSM 19665 = JCM 12249 = ATCC 15930 TaxID=1122985 RepID=A0A069QNW3_HOYLO|nr:hypothetical protein HMPREF1991_02454 [Hoylesella loescheii DSM 19665 = JCM 12249 = ATCC 15930]
MWSFVSLKSLPLVTPSKRLNRPSYVSKTPRNGFHIQKSWIKTLKT